MENNPELLFSKIVRPAQTILEELGPDRKVYPLAKILIAFEISKLDYDIYNLRWYRNLMLDADSQLLKLQSLLNDRLSTISKEDCYVEANPERGFDTMGYLETTCLRVSTYIDNNGGDCLCYPWA